MSNQMRIALAALGVIIGFSLIVYSGRHTDPFAGSAVLHWAFWSGVVLYLTGVMLGRKAVWPPYSDD